MHKPKHASIRHLSSRLSCKKDHQAQVANQLDLINKTHTLSDFAEMHLAPGYRAYVRDDRRGGGGDKRHLDRDFAWRYLQSQKPAS